MSSTNNPLPRSKLGEVREMHDVAVKKLESAKEAKDQVKKLKSDLERSHDATKAAKVRNRSNRRVPMDFVPARASRDCEA